MSTAKNTTSPGIITQIWLDESRNECTMCGACEASCPEIFEVPEKMRVVGTPAPALFKAIWDAADHCPVLTIALELNGSGHRNNPY